MYAWYQWLVFTHIAAVFIFLMAHGVSALVIFRVKEERDLEALRALLGLSSLASLLSGAALVVLTLTGVAATFAGSLWGFIWPWAALIVLAIIWLLMALEAGPTMRRVRLAAGFTGPMEIGADAKPDQLATAQDDLRPWISATIGGVGLLVILWLMVLQPF